MRIYESVLPEPTMLALSGFSRDAADRLFDYLNGAQAMLSSVNSEVLEMIAEQPVQAAWESGIESSLGSIQGAMLALQSSVASLQSSVTSLLASDVTTQGNIAALQAAVTALNAGLSPTVTTPTRALGTAFRPSATRPALVAYAARITTTLSLTAGAIGRVELVSDAVNPPTTVRARMGGGNSGALVVGLSVSDIAEGTMAYLVPAGHYVLLRSVAESGSPTFALTSQVEEVL